MGVEGLLDNRIYKIDDLVPVEKQMETSVFTRYRKLQNTLFRDSGSGQWIRSIKNDAIVDTARFAEDQLVGVVVEGMFDRESAKSLYGKLQETPLFYSRYDEWKESVSEDGFESVDYFLADQLLGILAEGSFDNENAAKRYHDRKRSVLYMNEKKEWQDALHKGRYFIDRLTGDLLIDVLVEGMFDREKAFETYEDLKHSKLYNREQKRWLSFTVDPANPKMTIRDQFYGILVEGLFDTGKAKILYEDLKKTELYLEDTGLWLSAINSDQTIFDRNCLAGDQLRGIWIEKMFEDEGTLMTKGEALPMVRRF